MPTKNRGETYIHNKEHQAEKKRNRINNLAALAKYINKIPEGTSTLVEL